MSRHGGTAVFKNMPDLHVHCTDQQQSGSKHWNVVVSLDNVQWIYLSSFINVSWQLTLFCTAWETQQWTTVSPCPGGILLHSSVGVVPIDECNAFFTYFCGIREISLMLFVWFFFFVRMKVKKLPKILALHLKRFKYMEQLQRYAKLSYRVVFPFELRLFNTVSIIDHRIK